MHDTDTQTTFNLVPLASSARVLAPGIPLVIGHQKKRQQEIRVARRRQDTRSTLQQRSSGGRPTIPFIHYGAGITVNKLRSPSVPLAPRGLPVVNGGRDWAVWTSFLWGWV
ncbi:uncharacterized protein CCOS01_02736 [Colletotrichum costaricense]|uniref:Uncharacterized protein n=2 Tax=Colletotrichum acutatum species complex TaxID=2707335 RepID=A0AAJ0E7E7_9PEZI|nr:uncharacterized protein CCOS01_02736 [Colletotrichum costaricense]XP_060383330.1 uncharacterized protein CTAM01_06110 [Colletotrichum tamarilloi]KAK1501385.1 hypothetical protein CTAM01_06110 [Colletotrichum tamarilloi]KAK1537416.1 hypothetical protein CCOS01_02736 [Colletotrichum costaricense]